MTQNCWNSPELESAGDGKVLIGSGSGRPAAANITGDSDVSISNGANSITVNMSESAGALVKISTATASSSASISFTDLSSTYFMYIIRFSDVQPATDSTFLAMRTSTNNGSSYDSGASDYVWAMNYINQAGSENGENDTADSWIRIIGDNGINDMGTGTNEKGSGVIYLYNPSAAKYTFINSEAFFFNEDLENTNVYVGGFRASAADVDAVQLLMSSGNIASGSFVLYGVKNT